ncbi:Serine/threonine-protein kinase SULU [Caenorhabditis elegans]|uniref:Serine/threonine-protein kinase SULU n=1 Tax=Caenorhabditis elegans TaxID=6239 RepID=UPI0013A8020A|nr:Serine/threonine-protein kinase SULU [Caenorhabditis elegans]CCD63181.2 Serine/threonine-protein kinase SULU [Caenorhabditis elegans]
MAPAVLQKPGVIKDPSIAALFSNKDPEQRYQDLREIGHGSFGAVYFAYDKKNEQTVAIKKMNFSGKQAVEKWNDILKEVSFLNTVVHPHIVDYKACFLKDTTCWLVMEYCIGSAADIVDVLRKGMREVEIAAICSQTLDALRYLHSLKRIHRDIKAGNILLSDHAIVKLADFGSASLVDPAQTFIGTPFFMAPEVILAMDEGHYTDRADIWSLGITCIELAERRPPLFSMNAMSALYHIAQNDPPTLSPIDTSEQPEWSLEFVQFIDKCLRKPAEERMSAEECFRHPFIQRSRPSDTIQELIQRTKNMVLELDNFQYKKMRKLMYLDETEGKEGSEGNGASDDLDFHGNEANSIGRGDSASSRSASLTSFRSMQSSGGAGLLVSTNTTGAMDNVHGSSGYGNGSSSTTSSARRRPPIPSQMLSSTSTSGVGTMPSHGSVGASITAIAVNPTPSPSEPIPTSQPTSKSESSSILETAHDDPLDTSIRAPVKDLHMPHRAVKERIATLQNHKFATLRSQRIINQEQEEYTKENNMYEQMSKYKHLRQAHHKELQQFEERCALDREQLRVKMDRELEQLTTTYSKEKMRVRCSQNNELDKRKKDIEDGEKKMKKTKNSQNQQQMKLYSAQQLKEYKYNKEAQKTRLRSLNMPRSTYENAMKEVKADLNRVKDARENDFDEKLRAELEDEIVRYRRQQLSNLHQLEEQLDDEDVNVQERQMDTRHGLLSKQHEMTRDLEIQHLNELHAMKKRHLETQHEAESASQNEYTQRQQDELRKKHAMQSRQQPRDLKIQEAQIRKQYRQVVKTQTRQFKLYLTQMVQVVPKDEQKELTSRLKQDQMQKVALLASQYESQIKKMVQDKTVKLESWQEDEQRVLSEKLEKELEELIAYQKKTRATLEEQIKKERTALEERIGTRRAMLEQKIIEEREQMGEMRRLKKEQIRDRHSQERHRLENHFVRTGSTSRSSGGIAPGVGNSSSIQMAM